MKKVLRSASALAAVMVAAPVAAHATDGWYGRADAGYSFDGGVDISGTPVAGPTTLNGETDHDDNWLGSIGIGYGFASGFRVEGETAYRFNSLKPFTGATGSLLTGDTHVWSGMLNLFYDFNKGGTFQPYIGGGVGAGRLALNAASAVDYIDEVATGFAYQGMAGVGIALTEQLTLDVGYKYFAMNDVDMIGTRARGGTLGFAPISADVGYDQHAATVGLRWQFAAPPPPPEPPPPPPVEAAPVVQVCPAQDFKVYFEWDRSNLNAAAIDTVNAAVARAKECNVSTVRVVGFTDTSGSPAYNLGLSNRRASVVRDALVSAGLDASLITSEGLGETNLDKETADGVREPLNRRTAVTISFQ